MSLFTSWVNTGSLLSSQQKNKPGVLQHGFKVQVMIVRIYWVISFFMVSVRNKKCACMFSYMMWWSQCGQRCCRTQWTNIHYFHYKTLPPKSHRPGLQNGWPSWSMLSLEFVDCLKQGKQFIIIFLLLKNGCSVYKIQISRIHTGEAATIKSLEWFEISTFSGHVYVMPVCNI